MLGDARSRNLLDTPGSKPCSLAWPSWADVWVSLLRAHSYKRRRERTSALSGEPSLNFHGIHVKYEARIQ